MRLNIKGSKRNVNVKNDYKKIPNDAALVLHCKIVDDGVEVEYKVYQGAASKGYQSDYKRVPHRWTVSSGPWREIVSSWSGRNYDKPLQWWNDIQEEGYDEVTIIREEL